MEARDLDKRYVIDRKMEQRIWAMRCEEGCSQQEIAERLGSQIFQISQSTISRCLKRLIEKHNLFEKENSE